ncbi:MAG: YMGG-like glycine zipper-containing protein [Pseudomonadota bacterium]
MTVSACASSSQVSSGSGDYAYTVQETAIRRDSDNFNRTVAQGAGAGAAVGALIGGLAGGWRGAAIGAGAGLLLGGLAGTYVGQKQREYANAEARTDAMIADVRQDNLELASYVATTRQVVANDRLRLAQLDSQYRSGQLDRREAKIRLARIRENRDVIGETMVALRERRDEYTEASQITRNEEGYNQQIAQLDAEISRLNRNIQVLESEVSSLDDALAVSPIA